MKKTILAAAVLLLLLSLCACGLSEEELLQAAQRLQEAWA